MDRTNKSLIAVSAVSGALLGWVVKQSVSKRQERVDYKPFVERVKNRERNFYAEGRKRAKEIESIKQEVHHKIEQ
ncbi:hypothetical protein KFZ58_01060 [Virgibacillus sp. NKC19-16]|uniref:hypothetical protein n=1 Tax=Virgibacillus salidurans TaxID=2831673 RepID=UPI001F48F47F|nr:hypothetical protein [Virgibacillus sp. NKC19-16]UJL46593.1 hypothetical protein KFZ58_01060 [Virgibacillus sp. NKC19-16]